MKQDHFKPISKTIKQHKDSNYFFVLQHEKLPKHVNKNTNKYIHKEMVNNWANLKGKVQNKTSVL